MLPLLAVAGGAALAGGIASFLANKSATDRAAMLQDQGLQQFLQVAIPDPAQLKLALQQFVVQGKLNPQLEGAISQQPSEFSKIVTNASNKTAQSTALQQLQQIGQQGGLRPQDKATIQDAMLNAQVRERGQRQAISQGMANRGLGGSGFEVASLLQNQQGEADRDAQTSLDTAGTANQRALVAIQGAGQLGTQYRTQEFGEKAQQAGAQDAINQFNTQNLQSVQQRNVASQNQAQAQNLANAQDVANKNTNLSNYEQQYNKDLTQKNFENQLQRAAGAAGQYQPMAQTAMQSGQQAGNFATNVGAGVAGAATSQANMNFWDDYFKDKNRVKGDTMQDYQNLP